MTLNLGTPCFSVYQKQLEGRGGGVHSPWNLDYFTMHKVETCTRDTPWQKMLIDAVIIFVMWSMCILGTRYKKRAKLHVSGFAKARNFNFCEMFTCSLTDIFSLWKIGRIQSIHHDKSTNFIMRNNKNCQEIPWKQSEHSLFYSELAPTYPWCNKLQTLLGRKEYEEGMSDKQPLYA